MKIEFLGLSGAGKTTMSKHISKSFNIPNRSRRERGKFSLFPFIKSLKNSLKMIIFLRKLTGYGLNFSNFKAFQSIYYIYNNSKSFTTGHGFIQTLLQDECVYKKLDNEKLNKFLDFIPQDILLILINTKKSEAKKKAQDRNLNFQSDKKYDSHFEFFKILSKCKRVHSVTITKDLKSSKQIVHELINTFI